MEQPSVIEIYNLSKAFRDFWGRPKVKAVSGLSLDIKKGEVFGLLGPNGSGKSTTIKMILGLLFPSAGSIRVFGRSPRDVRAKMLIGYMPEESNLYRFLDAEETLDFYGRLFNFPSKERNYRTKALLDLVGLTRERKRPLSEYSKGMSRRIGLAQALVNDPELAILDEPTTGLDPIGTREVKDLILDLKHRGKTVLLCSHLLADVEDVCDRIGILYGGKLIALGKVNELLARTNITQISAENLKKETLNKVLEFMSKEVPDHGVKVDNPSQKLEEFFLNVIEAAREKQMESSGAEAGRTASEVKLSGELLHIKQKRISLLSKLTGGKEKKAEVFDEAVPAPAQESRKDKILSELASEEASIKAAKEKESEEQKAREAELEKDRQAARKSVLGRLTDGDKDKGGSNA
jgi:ABC-2 type transport system ATP-binding protein